MMSVVEELKGKLAELEARLEAIMPEAPILEGQKGRTVCDRAQYVGDLPAQPHVKGALLPGDHRHVPIQAF